MDKFGSARPTACVGDRLQPATWGWKHWATWGNLGLLLVAAVVPFGWLLPAARLVRVTVRRPRNF